MRSLKKIAVTSLLSVSMLAATNVVSYNQSNHSIQFGHQKVFAAEDMPEAMKSALKTISGVGPDGSPPLSADERNAVKDLIENPKKYVDAKTGDELLNLINGALDKPAVLAKAGSHEIDKDTILGNLRNELNTAMRVRGTATTGVDGRKDDTKRDLSDLTANENYSTLYASVIYSLSKGESADSASISLNQLSKYPVQDGNGQNQQYGALATPSLTTPKNPIGSQLASYIQTLHDYNYLVMKDKTGFSGIWNTLTGWASTVVRGVLLSTAMMGAMIYDFSLFMIKTMSDAFTKFNILKVTGISAGAEAANTLVENMLGGVLNIFGLTGETIRLFQYSLYTILLGVFVIKVISQLNKAKAKQAVKTTKLTTLRVFTIIMTIPVTAMMYGVSSTLFDSLKNAATDASRISDSYVINVTKWAGTLNLSLDPMGTSAVSSSNSGVKADKKFEPTPSNIAKLNSAIRAIDDANAEKSDNKQRSAQLAMTAIGNLMIDKEESVQGYFNYIAANGQSGSNMAAESLPTTAASDSQTGRSNAYLYVSRDKKEDALDKLKSLLGLDPKAGEADDEAGKSYSYDINGQTVAITPASKADLVPVAWNNPTSYLYGAVPPGNLTTSTLNHANYHLSAYTNMLNDPKTDEVASDQKLKDALVKNAQNFALINKYAGIKNYGGENPALSSQSVAFLLQSKVSNGSINYKGYNTAANSAGSSKNTGAYGITYVENVVPSNGVADYMGKIASLNAIWIAAGYTAMIVMLTLLKSPILGAIVRHLKGFFQALFVGDIIGLLESITFYLALSSSFVFGYLGILFGTSLIQQLIGEGSVASALSFLTLIPTYGPILVSWIVVFILTWPVVSLSLGRSGKRRKAGIIELIVAMPYLIAESLDPAFDRMYSRLYGKSRSQTLGAKLANKAQAVDPGSVLKDNLKKGAGLALTGIQAAGSAIPGYGTAAAAAAGVMKGVINGKGGGMDADPNDPNAIIPSTGNGLIDGAARLGLGLAKDKLGDDKNKPLDAERDASMIEYDEFGNPIERDPVTGLPIKGNDPSKEHYGDLSSTGNASEIDGTIPVDSQTPQEQAVDDSQAKLDEIAKNTQALKDKDGNDIVIDPNDPNASNEPLEVEDAELKVPEIKDPEVDQLRDPKLENADQLHDVNVENAEDLKDVDLHNTDDLKDVDLNNTDQLHDVDVTDADKLRDVNVENADQLHDLGIDDTDKLHIDTPNINPLNVNDPDLHIDDPDIEAPEIKPVDVNDPAIEIPEVKPLDVNDPDLHINDPKIETPEIKPVDVNDHKIEIPDIKPLDVNDPAITAPDLNIDDPKIESPELKADLTGQPDIKASDITIPEIKDVKADLTGQPEIKIPEIKDVTATVTNPAQQAAPEIKIPEMKDVTATVTNQSQTVTAPVQEGPTIINNQTTNQTGPAGTTTPTPPQSAGPQNVKVDLAGFSHQGKDFQFDPSKVEIKMPDRKPENFDAMRSFSRGKQEAKDLTKQTVNAVIDGASASVIGQTIASAVAPLGDQIKAAKTGQPVETVRQERIIEQAAKQEARETQIVRDSVEKQITKEILIKENLSRGMSADQAESFAKVQQGIANLATSPLGKLAGAMAKPAAFAADRTVFDDKNVMQNILNGKRPEGLDKKPESHAYESKSYQDRRNEERMMDTLDRIADNMERDRDRY